MFKQGASFNGTEIKRGAFFHGASFEGEEAADFQLAQISVQVEFEGAVFKQGASFTGAKINGNVLFLPATSGKEVRPVRFEGAADFGSARIEGHAVFQGTVLKQGASFNSAQVNGSAHFRGAIFEGEKAADFISARIGGQAEFNEAVFKQGASFNGTQVNGNALFRGAIFEGKGMADFRNARIEGHAEFDGAMFRQGASFNSAEIKRSAFFRPATSGKEVRPVRFEGAADFGSARIGVQAEFNGAVFKQGASFNSAQINGGALFRNTTFEGERAADFGSARIEGQAEFDGTVFKQRASFNSAEIKRAAFFRLAISGKEVRPVRFERAADFGSARIEGQAEFDGAVFQQGASFNSAQINGNALFRNTTFEGERAADFISAQIDGQAEFDRAVFQQGASFNSAQINGNALFRNTTFEGERAADFGSARIEGQADFDGAVFKQGANFNAAQIDGSVFFKGAKFDKDFDLQGFVYKRIDVSWEDLERRLNPRDAQVYAQLETAFRQSGRSATASEIYYASRYVEGDKIGFKKEPFRWFNDRRARWLVGYGQSPFRLLWLLLFFVGIGTFVFRREGAVEPKDRATCPLHSGSQCTITYHRLPYGLAFWVSLNAFLPGAEVMAANAWGPTPSRYLINKKFLKITYIGLATILRMFGWIVLVLGFSALPEFLLR